MNKNFNEIILPGRPAVGVQREVLWQRSSGSEAVRRSRVINEHIADPAPERGFDDPGDAVP